MVPSAPLRLTRRGSGLLDCCAAISAFSLEEKRRRTTLSMCSKVEDPVVLSASRWHMYV